jgi:small-conductance mechanosensitive channel
MMNWEQIEQFLQQEIWHNEVWNFLAAGFTTLVLILLLPYIKTKFIDYTEKLAAKTSNTTDDLIVEIIKKISNFSLSLIGVFIGSKFLNLPTVVDRIANQAILIILAYEAAKVANRLLRYFLVRLARRNQESENAILFLGKIANFGVWALAIVFLLQNFGIEVGSLIAGLGIGGIAVALAAQSVLGDVFSSFSIFFDKPFRVGDYIMVGNQRGTVKKVGIKTTRIESLTGEELIISNTDLTSSRIQNFKRMEKRRVSFTFGVEYSTPFEKVKKIPEIIREIVEPLQEKIELDRVHFAEFGDFSLKFEVVIWVLDSDYTVYMNYREKINLAMMEKFATEKIVFAYPTQTILLEKNAD